MSQLAEIPESQATLNDYEAVANDFQIVEFITGDILVTPPPSIAHQRISRELLIAIGNYFKKYPIGEVFSAPTGLLTQNEEVLEPDIQIILQERKEIIKNNYIKGVPNIIIEILSPSTQHRDWGIKKDIYEELGVEEYWLIEPEKKVAYVFRLDKKKRQFKESIEVKFGKGEKLTTPLMSKFDYTDQ